MVASPPWWHHPDGGNKLQRWKTHQVQPCFGLGPRMQELSYPEQQAAWAGWGVGGLALDVQSLRTILSQEDRRSKALASLTLRLASPSWRHHPHCGITLLEETLQRISMPLSLKRGTYPHGFSFAPHGGNTHLAATPTWRHRRLGGISGAAYARVSVLS